MKISSSVLVPALVLAFGVTLNASAQPITRQQDDAQAQQDRQMPDASAKATSVFAGKVMKDKKKGLYILMDTSTNVSYGLDDQAKAKEFAGKAVRVTGTLETASNTIHIENIEPAA